MTQESGVTYPPLLIHFFETEVAIYNCMSGTLHLLSILGADLLLSIRQGAGMPCLVNKFLDYNDLNIEEAEILVRQFIHTYRDLGLIE